MLLKVRNKWIFPLQYFFILIQYVTAFIDCPFVKFWRDLNRLADKKGRKLEALGILMYILQCWKVQSMLSHLGVWAVLSCSLLGCNEIKQKQCKYCGKVKTLAWQLRVCLICVQNKSFDNSVMTRKKIPVKHPHWNRYS